MSSRISFLAALLCLWSVTLSAGDSFCSRALRATEERRVDGLLKFINFEAHKTYQENRDTNREAFVEMRLRDKSRDLLNDIMFRSPDGKKRPGFRPPTRRFFVPLMRSIERSRLSFHSADFLNTDLEFALELPEIGSETPWAILSPREREHLVYSLAYHLRNYIEPMRSLKDGHRSFTDLYAVFPRGEHGAFDPVSIFAARDIAEHRVSIARLANPALAGILGELGATNQDVVLVEGIDPRTKLAYLWVQVRFSLRGPWQEVDATPDSGHAAMSEKPILHTFQESPSQIFTENQHVIPFLKPLKIQWHPLSGRGRPDDSDFDPFSDSE